LRQAADEAHLLVGAAVRPSLFSEAAYSATLAREFNMVEAEDVMKWWTVRREGGQLRLSRRAMKSSASRRLMA
jgi:GH35 family endo-1,4-beta-xylanase